MVLSRTGGSVNYQCGAGTIDSTWTLTADGTFTGTGLHYFGGGPVPSGGRQPHPARYVGHVTDDRLALSVVLTDLDQTLGPFQMVRDGPGVTELCD